MAHKDRVAHSERAAKAKLTSAQVQAIRAEYAAGSTQVTLAQRYGCSQAAISQMLRGKSWRRVPQPSSDRP